MKTNLIVKNIKHAFKTQDENLFHTAMEQLQSKINNFQLACHLPKKNLTLQTNPDCIIDVQYVDNSTSKLTINPNTKRCTLKITNKCSKQVEDELTIFTRLILEQCQLPLLTVRAPFRYNHHNNTYSAYLLSESKKFRLNCIFDIQSKSILIHTSPKIDPSDID